MSDDHATDKSTPSARSILVGRLIALVLGFAILLVMSEIGLRIAMPHWKEFHSGRFMRKLFLPEYGVLTTGRPGFKGYFAQNNGDFRAYIEINEFGLRNDEPISAADGRIWVIGDSMTFGWGVERPEMYSSVLAEKYGMPTYNVASPGTDVCGYQGLLARMPTIATPRAVVVGLILENDLLLDPCNTKADRDLRATSSAAKNGTRRATAIKIKGFMTKNFAIYNFFTVSLKRVDVLRVLLTKIGLINEPHRYRISIPEARVSEAVKQTAAELANFKAMLPIGTPLVVLIAPGRFEIKDGNPLYRDLRNAMVAELGKLGVPTVDPFRSFESAGFIATHFAHDGHWTVVGHRLAGEALARWFRTAR